MSKMQTVAHEATLMLSLSTQQSLNALLTWGCCSGLVHVHADALDWVLVAGQDTDNSYSSGASLSGIYSEAVLQH